MQRPTTKHHSQGMLRLGPVMLALFVLIWVGGCNSLFFQPDQIEYLRPHQFGLWHEEVRFTSSDGTSLHGWFLPARGRALGTVVHFHGNGANISNHLPQVGWLPAQGYHVFTFDYRGYGLSDGDPEREAVVQDGVAALEYVRGRKDVDPKRMVVWGQSLGGAVAVASLARAGAEGVHLLVLEASFASYREIVRTIMDRSWVTWVFQYPVSRFFVSDAFSPRDEFAALADVPLLVVHSQRDPVVPFENGQALHDTFPGADKAFWAIPSTQHLGHFTMGGSHGRKLLDYMQAKLPPLPPEGFRFRTGSTPTHPR